MRRLAVLALTLTLVGAAAISQETTSGDGQVATIPVAEGLAAWERIYEVTSHPRCVNCHVGESDRPMWSGPNYGGARPHGMNIRAGDSRIGAETLPCATCHGASNGDAPHSPPGNPSGWMLAPVEAGWFGTPSAEICAQLRDPARNGGRTIRQVADHLGHDLILRWAWAPGPGREPAPFTHDAHIQDILIWGAAGAPCPE